MVALVGQAGVAGSNTAGPFPVTYAGTAGNLLAIVGHTFNLGAGNAHTVYPTSITDSAGAANTWHLSTADTAGTTTGPPTEGVSGADAGGIAGDAQTDFIAWSFLAQSVTQVTLNVQNQASPVWWRFTVAEFSAVGAFDNSWAGKLTNASALTAGPVNLPVAGCLVLAAVDWDGPVGTENGPGFPWVTFTAASGGDLSYVIAGQGNSISTGPLSAGFGAGGPGMWAGTMAVFTPPGSTVSGAASLAAPGALAVSATLTVPGAAALTAPGGLTAVPTDLSAAALASVPSLSAAAVLERQGAAALAAPGGLTAVPFGTAIEGVAALSAGPAMNALAHVRPEGLWAIYVAAAEAAAADAQRWRMYRSLVGGSSQSGFAYGSAFEAENAADQAYQNWQAAYRAEFPGAAG